MSTSKPLWQGESLEAFKELLAAYKDVVESKGHMFRADMQTLQHLKSISIWLTTSTEKRGIYLGGNCGNGKSTMMMAFLKVCRQRGMRVLSTSTTKMVAWHLNDHSVLDLPHQEKIICVDDLGAEAAEVLVYGNKVSVMADFFEEVYKTNCFLFVTSNLGAEEIGTRYGQRVRDRFREMFHALKFSNPSFR